MVVPGRYHQIIFGMITLRFFTNDIPNMSRNLSTSEPRDRYSLKVLARILENASVGKLLGLLDFSTKVLPCPCLLRRNGTEKILRNSYENMSHFIGFSHSSANKTTQTQDTLNVGRRRLGLPENFEPIGPVLAVVGYRIFRYFI